MPVNFDNDTPQTMYVLYKRGIQSKLEGVMSEESEDFLYYNGETYRDEIDAAFMGRASLIAGNSDNTTFIAFGGASDIKEETTIGGPPAPGWTPATASDPQFEESDSYNHEPPRALQITRTLLRWWSGVNATGHVIGWAWADTVEDTSSSPFERI